MPLAKPVALLEMSGWFPTYERGRLRVQIPSGPRDLMGKLTLGSGPPFQPWMLRH